MQFYTFIIKHLLLLLSQSLKHSQISAFSLPPLPLLKNYYILIMTSHLLNKWVFFRLCPQCAAAFGTVHQCFCLTTLSYVALSIVGENRGASTSCPAAKELCYVKYMSCTLSCVTYVLLSRPGVLTFTVQIFQK